MIISRLLRLASRDRPTGQLPCRLTRSLRGAVKGISRETRSASERNEKQPVLLSFAIRSRRDFPPGFQLAGIFIPLPPPAAFPLPPPRHRGVITRARARARCKFPRAISRAERRGRVTQIKRRASTRATCPTCRVCATSLSLSLSLSVFLCRKTLPRERTKTKEYRRCLLPIFRPYSRHNSPLGFLFFFSRVFSRARARAFPLAAILFLSRSPTREETKGTRGEMRPLRYKSHALRAGSRSNELLAPFRAPLIPVSPSRSERDASCGLEELGAAPRAIQFRMIIRGCRARRVLLGIPKYLQVPRD